MATAPTASNPQPNVGTNGVKTEKEKSSPKDAQVMMSILKDMGIMEFEPRVVNQLLEFSYRYVTNVIDDAKILANHAKKKAIDMDDVKLAVQMYTEQNFTTPPSRDILLDTARTKNLVPMPVPKPTVGLRLPPDRHCLTACNYKLKMKSKKFNVINTAKPQFKNKIVLPGGGQQQTFSVVKNQGKLIITLFGHRVKPNAMGFYFGF